MTKQVFLTVSPFSPAQRLTQQKSHEVITPSPLAAKALGTRPISLRDIATQQLKNRNIKIASALTSQKVFRQTVQEILAPNDPVGIARSLLPTVRKLLQASASLDNLPAYLSPRAQRILQLLPEYQARLRAVGCVDSSELYWRTLEKTPDQQKVLIYGYFHLRPDELAFVNAIAAEDSILLLPTLDTDLFPQNQAAIAFLTSQGWHIDSTQTSPQNSGELLYQSFLQPKPAHHHPCPVYAYDNLESEVRGTLAQVKQLLQQQVKPQDIVIIARNEIEYGPLLLDIAWEYDLPLRALYDTPLNSTRLGAWLNLLLEVIDNQLPFESTAKLLSHPLCTNPDAEFWAEVRSVRPMTLEDWTKFSQKQIGIDLSILKKIPRYRRDKWVVWVRNFFQAFDLRRRCARWPREILAFNTLDSSLTSFAQPESEILRWAEFTQELQDTLDLLTVPAQPGRGGVELHNPQAIVGTQYRHVFVIGMAEGVFPAPIQNDPVLDFYERKQLSQAGLPLDSAAAAARQEALSFCHLLQSITDQVVFSYAKLSDRQPQAPSPYLQRLNLSETPIPSLPLASPEEVRRYHLRWPIDDLENTDPVLTSARHAWSVEQSREDTSPPDEYDGIVGIPVDYSTRLFSVSQLTSLGQCPFQWFAARVLKLGEPDEIESDLSPSLRGNLYHKTIELLFQAIRDNPARSLTDPALLRTQFLAAEKAINLPQIPAWEVRRTEHIRILHRTLQQPDFLPAGAEALSFEGAFEGNWQGFKIRGRVDRIDRTSAGLVLIDYKTGQTVPKGVTDENGIACLDLQLPIYQAVAAPHLFPDQPVADAYYYSLGKGQKLSVPQKSQASPADLLAFADRCKSHLDNGHFPVQPDKEKVACKYCSFKAVCRVGSRLSRKGVIIDESD